MIRATFALIAGMLFTLVAAAATPTAVTTAAPGDPMVPIRQFIDGFNAGDTKTAYAAYAAGDIAIVDEFAPHRWLGRSAPKNWAADYDKHAAAFGVSAGLVKYGEPTRTEISGKSAYVIIPTVYSYKDHGKPTVEEGQMTYVLRSGASGWKITAWTWTGVKPHAPK
jgi:ketosteroid isomerase-like protein